MFISRNTIQFSCIDLSDVNEITKLSSTSRCLFSLFVCRHYFDCLLVSCCNAYSVKRYVSVTGLEPHAIQMRNSVCYRRCLIRVCLCAT